MVLQKQLSFGQEWSFCKKPMKDKTTGKNCFLLEIIQAK